MDGETWTLLHGGRLHEVRVEHGRGRIRADWLLDGELVATKVEWGKTLTMAAGTGVEDASDATLGAVGVKAPTWFGATHRVVWLPVDAVDFEEDKDNEQEADQPDEIDAHSAELQLSITFAGATDLVPEAGSRAEARLAWIERHPRLHVVRSVLGAGGVVVPLFLFATLIGVLEPYLPQWEIPSPNLSRFFPDISLPRIPWPDIPWPDLPDWLGPTLKVLLAVAVAWGVAHGEIQRRRKARVKTETRADDEESVSS